MLKRSQGHYDPNSNNNLVRTSEERVHDATHALEHLNRGRVDLVLGGSLKDLQAACALVKGALELLIQDHLKIGQRKHIDVRGRPPQQSIMMLAFSTTFACLLDLSDGPPLPSFTPVRA